MLVCDMCGNRGCGTEGSTAPHANCPMTDGAFFDEELEKYRLAENYSFYRTCTALEAKGYCEWPRAREVVEFCLSMGYRKIGLAFCNGLRSEARIMGNVLREHGFEVCSVMCKTGGRPKESVGVPPEEKVKPNGFEVMCNPIAQAELLNREGTEFNVVIGLCVGHDSLFYKYSQAMVTTLIAKDRVLAHNPAGALYCADTYFKKRLYGEGPKTPEGER